MAQNRPNGYREIFFAAHGFGPFACSFCSEGLEFDTLVVHHVNHDKSDNRVENMVAAHRGCHMRHHNSGEPASKRMKEAWDRVPAEQKKERMRRLSPIGACVNWNINRGKPCTCGNHKEASSG